MDVLYLDHEHFNLGHNDTCLQYTAIKESYVHFAMDLKKMALKNHIPRLYKKRSEKKGRSPGSLIFIGEKRVETVSIDLTEYTPDDITRTIKSSLSEIHACKASPTNSWIDVVGIHDSEVIKDLGEHFGIHILNQEDVMNTDQRPKCDVSENGMYIVLQMLRYENGKISSEQVSLWLTDKCLLSFQEVPGDVFEPVRERLQNPQSKLRNRGVDYLAIALLDTIIDNYVHILERFGEELEALEEELLDHTDNHQLATINTYKKELHFLRRSVRPVRELVLQLQKAESLFLKPNNIPFIKDISDHIIQAVDSVELYREMLNDLMNLHQSGMNNKQNEILKVLTVFSVVFIPLTFIAGVYGTNFEYLPELHHPYAYYIFWGAEILIGLAMLLYFKSRDWL
jgi:magnesium transporter